MWKRSRKSLVVLSTVPSTHIWVSPVHICCSSIIINGTLFALKCSGLDNKLHGHPRYKGSEVGGEKKPVIGAAGGDFIPEPVIGTQTGWKGETHPMGRL